VKFCGITRLADAEQAVALGAWAVGMVLWPGSPRCCDIDEATTIGAALHRRAEVAGVFVNAHLDEAARRTGCKVIKAARVRGAAEVRALHAFPTDFHLLDAYVSDEPGGTGETFAWELAREHRRKRPLLLSGGLTPENVGEAIAAVQPFAVDVASGVESAPGVKDHARMAAFASAVAASASEAAA
jgi:phosphoribosylanthranilate isomerase